jgi:hypothetical protein
MVATVHMQLEPCSATHCADLRRLVEGLVTVFKEQKHGSVSAMLLEDQRLNSAERVPVINFDVLDFADMLALVKNVY